MKRLCWTILNKAWSWRGVVFRWAPMDLPGTRVPVAACLRRMRLTVARVRPTRPAIAPCHIPWRASASTLCLNTYRGWTGHYYNNQWELRKNMQLLREMTIQAAVLDFDDSTWHWSESPARVRSDFIGKQSHVHFLLISAHWKQHKNSIHIDFIASNGSVAIFFPKVYIMFFNTHWCSFPNRSICLI